jgi:16S rRNA G966 N2-methylase RsmD
VVQTILKENIKTLKMTDSSEISPSFKAIQKSPTKTREDAIEKTREKKGVDFIFLDPPYFSQEGGIPLYSHALTSLKEFIGPGTLIVIETDAKEMVMKDEPTLDTLSFLFEKIYGTVKLSFYKKSFLA